MIVLINGKFINLKKINFIDIRKDAFCLSFYFYNRVLDVYCDDKEEYDDGVEQIRRILLCDV